MKADTCKLISELESITGNNIKTAEGFKNLTLEQLNKKPSETGWSILECLEHLNRYDAFYLPAIQNHLNKFSSVSISSFKSGLIGNYLVKSIIPNNKGKKIKTFAAMNPAGIKLGLETIDAFIAGQYTLLKQLEEARNKDLNKAGVPVTFTKLITLKLGDALRFMVYHNLRHILQAERMTNATL